MGAGTLTFNGANTYTGETLVEAGVLRYGIDDAIASGPVMVNGATAVLEMGGHRDRVGTITVDGGGLITGGTLVSTASFELKSGRVSAMLAGDGIVVNKTTAGTVILSGANTYDGGTQINGGALQFASPFALPATGVIAFGGGRLQYNTLNVLDMSPRFSQAADQAYAVDTNGLSINFNTPLTSAGGSFTKLGAGTLTFNVRNSYDGSTTIAGGMLCFGLDDAIAGGLVINGPAAVLNLNDHLATVPYIVLDGGGYIMAGTLTAIGTIQMKEGGVSANLAGNGVSLTKSTIGTVILSGSNAYNGGTQINGGVLLLGSPNAIASAGIISFNGGTLSFGPQNATDYSARFSQETAQAYAVDTGGQIVIFGTPLGSTGGSFTKSGSGTLTFSVPNSYDGTTTVTGGTLRFNIDDAIASNRMAVAGQAVLDLHGHAEKVGYVMLTGGGTITAGSLVSGCFDMQSGRADANLDGEGATLSKTTEGTVLLTGNNTYMGGTNLLGGVLALGNLNALGSSGPILFSGGALQYGSSNSFDYSSRISTAPDQKFNIDTGGQAVTFQDGLKSGGTSSLTKAGAGTLTLLGNNSYGTTTIAGGTLVIGNGGVNGSLGSGAITNNGSLVINLAGNTTLSAPIFGTGSFASAGPGTVTLTASNSYASTTIQAGTLQIGEGGTTGSLGSGPVLNNGVLAFDRSDSVTVGNVISGTGDLSHVGSGTLILTGANNYSGSTYISVGPLQIGTGGTTGSLGSGVVYNAGSLIINRTGILALGSDIRGAGSLSLAGTGTTTLAGSNDFSIIALNKGVLSLNGNGALGGSGTISFSGGTLQFTATNTIDYSARFSTAAGQAYKIDTGGQAVSFDSPLVSGGGSITKLGLGTLTLSANTTSSSPITVSSGILRYSGDIIVKLGALTVNGSTSQLDLTNHIVSGTSVTLDNSGSLLGGTLTSSSLDLRSGTVTTCLLTASPLYHNTGVLILAGTNNFNSIRLNGGTLVLGSIYALGTSGGIAAIGGVLQYSAANTVDYSPRLAATTLGSNSTYNIDTGGQTITFSTAVTNSTSTSLSKLGEGTLNLNAQYQFHGPITINAGALRYGVDNALPSGVITLNGPTAILDLNGHLASASMVTLDEGVITGGTLTCSNLQLKGGTLAVTMGSNASYIKSGTGTVVLAGRTTYTGSISIQSGVLQVASNDAVPKTATAFSFSGGVLQYNAENLIDYSSRFSNGANQKYAVDTNGQTVTFSTSLTSSGGTFLKSGTGTLTFAASNSYTGGTTVSGGSLRVNNTSGSGTGSGPVTVASGASLGGSGVVGGTVTVASSGHLAPGGAVNFTVAGLTLSAGAILDSQLNMPDLIGPAGGNALTTITGNLSLAKNITVNASAGSDFGTGTYALLHYGTTSDNSNGFQDWKANIDWNGAPAGTYYTFARDTASATINLVVANSGGNAFPLAAPGGSGSGVAIPANATGALPQISLNAGSDSWIVNPVNSTCDGQTWNFALSTAPAGKVQFRGAQQANILSSLFCLEVPSKPGPGLHVGAYPIQSITLPAGSIRSGGTDTLDAAILAETIGLGFNLPDGTWIAAVDGNDYLGTGLDPRFPDPVAAGFSAHAFAGADPLSANTIAGALTSRQLNCSLDDFIADVFGEGYSSLNLAANQWTAIDGAWGGAPDLSVDPTGGAYRFWAIVDYDADFGVYAAQPVPEPASLFLVAIPTVLMLHRRRQWHPRELR